MRGRALLGGLAIVGVAAMFHRPPIDPTASALLDNITKASGDLSQLARDPAMGMKAAGVLPPRETPGALDPAITQANIDTTICRPGYATSARPPYAITGPLKRRMMDQQHPGESMADYELDHLVPISIGGAPLDMRDLWLQPRQGRANAGDKNVLAYVLWRLVCRHDVPLAEAQAAIARDWTAAYPKYATPANVERFHFRGGARD